MLKFASGVAVGWVAALATTTSENPLRLPTMDEFVKLAKRTQEYVQKIQDSVQKPG